MSADSKKARRPRRPPTLTRFLLDQLVEAGVDTIFGIPGDFIIHLCRVIEKDRRVRFRTLSHEPGVGFAAAGWARGSGTLGVACATYGAGALNMVNPVAAAYAEKTPVLVLTGAPGEDERESGILVHHQVKHFDSQRKVFAEVTRYQSTLDDPSADADRIRHAVNVCRLYSLPVYLEVPRDRVEGAVEVGRARGLDIPTDPGAVEEAAGEILEKIGESQRPVLVVGVEIQRRDLIRSVIRLAERLAIPVVTTFMGRGTFPADHPWFAGTYLGPASPPGVRGMVEGSDFVVMLGALLCDTNMGVRLNALDPRHLVHAVSRRVDVGRHHYHDVPLQALLETMVRRTRRRRGPNSADLPRVPFEAAMGKPAPGPLRVAGMIAEINRSFRLKGKMPVVSDTGDCLFCSHEIETQTVLASAYYATMGFAVPAAMGYEVAVGRRPLVLVGDGGFQMTGPELARARGWGVHPLVVLMNNSSWEMLQSLLPSGYNRVVDWRYAETARLWGAAAWKARTTSGFRSALSKARAHRGPALVEAILEPGDISRTLRAFTRSFAKTSGGGRDPGNV